MRPESLVRCTRCVLPETYPSISFDESGVCNYCHTYTPVSRMGTDELLRSVRQINRSDARRHDCLLPLSGGRDSTFAAYYAVKVLGLRVLALTYDNGFMPPQTIANIAGTVETLKIDHVTIKNDLVTRSCRRVLAAWLRNPSPGMISFLCTGCAPSLWAAVGNVCNKNQIPLIITGEGEPQGSSPSFAERLLMPRGGNVGKASKILGFVREVVKNPAYLASPSSMKMFLLDFCVRYAWALPLLRERILSPEVKKVEIFRYLDYSESTIISTISRELGWTKPTHSEATHRSDCKIHFLREYLYAEMLGCTKTDDYLSCMIREGMLSREESLARLKRETVFSKEVIAKFLAELGVGISDLDSALKRWRGR